MMLTDDAVAWLLVLTRVSGMMVGCPLLSHAQLPRLWKAGMAMALTALLIPLIAWPGQMNPHPNHSLLLLVVRELALGYALSWLSCLSLQVVSAVGALVDLQSGLSNASLLDPVRGESQSLFTVAFHAMASLLFLQADGPALLVQLMLFTFERFPLGAAWSGFVAASTAVRLGHWFFSMAVGLALPWMISLWALDLITGIVGRMLPQLNLLSAGPPLKILAAWWLALQYFQHWLHRFSAIQSDLMRGHWLHV
ncbi:flagellar biosynthetic protein FliR [bacterium]|nr:flagellar biosynthetic protein FliR [bacterium]